MDEWCEGRKRGDPLFGSAGQRGERWSRKKRKPWMIKHIAKVLKTLRRRGKYYFLIVNIVVRFVKVVQVS